jgi:hypothetical protein
MFHGGTGEALRGNVGDLLELERTLLGDRYVGAAPDEHRKL